ncbi:MAG TPA: hypothetical protein VNK46_02330 [Nitrospiraceae bacterium]|jgi:hypothetical protein|nr:hypothetical protein [Nitrospiraceae bacterium]
MSDGKRVEQGAAASLQFTIEEVALIADVHFFHAKAEIARKVRRLLETVHEELREEMTKASLLVPPGFDPHKYQFVKGEHLEDFPYQYLDYPKHFVGGEAFTFRSLFWWGHHFAFALILEGRAVGQYKRNLLDRFHHVAGRELHLSLAPTLWEWKRGEGYTLPITHDRKAQVAAVLAERSFFKILRFVPPADPAVVQGMLPRISRETFQAILPIVSS